MKPCTVSVLLVVGVGVIPPEEGMPVLVVLVVLVVVVVVITEKGQVGGAVVPEGSIPSTESSAATRPHTAASVRGPPSTLHKSETWPAAQRQRCAG